MLSFRLTTAANRQSSATLYLLSFLALSGCNPSAELSSCVFCNRGIEHASPTHTVCTDCHGGNARAWEKRTSHRGMHREKQHGSFFH